MQFHLSVLRSPRLRREIARLATRVSPSTAKFWDEIDAAYAAGNWEVVVDVVPRAMKHTRALMTPGNFIRLAKAQAYLGDMQGAGATLSTGRAKFGWSDKLRRASAERAMAAGEYDVALLEWKSIAIAQGQKDPRSKTRAFPRRGSNFAWYELAWKDIAHNWDSHWSKAGERPAPMMYTRVVETLRVCEDLELASALSLVGLRDYPQDAGLAQQATEVLVRSHPGVGTHAFLELLRDSSVPEAVSDVAATTVSADSLLADLAGMDAVRPDEVRLLTADRRSGAEFVIRANNFWDEHRLRVESLRLSTVDSWPERTAATDRLSATSWTVARRFARDRGREVGVADRALAQAVFHNVKQELCLKLPADRVAAEIAKSAGDQPVFIDIGPLKIPYLTSYPTSRMQLVYLYDALRRLGCNVVFVRFPGTAIPSRAHPFKRARLNRPLAINATPKIAALRPASLWISGEASDAPTVVVPSGIRAVRDLLDRVGDATVLRSGASIGRFAYDRSTNHDLDYEFNAHIHPAFGSDLPKFSFETKFQRAWYRSQDGILESDREPSAAEPAEAVLAVGAMDTSDWYGLLAQALLPYFREMVRAADELLEDRSVTDVHIGDYMYAEPMLVADRARARGSRVHLWPHSSNPVHVPFHGASDYASVRAVTRSGAKTWRTAMPTAEVIHDPTLMLQPPAVNTQWQAGKPLSLVVIGGRAMLRNLPILDIPEHEATYRAFFAGLEDLVDQGRVRVYFKPRGLTGEHESWLEEVVGRSAQWELVLDHPMRIDLPNPVMVSVSVGSSALLEGASRGIPGVLVRNGFARDYLATGEGGVRPMEVAKALDLVADVTHESAWLDLRNRQVEALKSEVT